MQREKSQHSETILKDKLVTTEALAAELGCVLDRSTQQTSGLLARVAERAHLHAPPSARPKYVAAAVQILACSSQSLNVGSSCLADEERFTDIKCRVGVVTVVSDDLRAQIDRLRGSVAFESNAHERIGSELVKAQAEIEVRRAHARIVCVQTHDLGTRHFRPDGPRQPLTTRLAHRGTRAAAVKRSTSWPSCIRLSRKVWTGRRALSRRVRMFCSVLYLTFGLTPQPARPACSRH